MVAAVRTPEHNLSIVKPGKPVESIADKLFRLLQKARDNQIQLFMESESERWFCTSSTMPGVVHAVGETGCSCAGWQTWRRCQHWALWLDKNGKRPPTDAELIAAEAELDRLRYLRDNNQLKSTADWRNLQNASHRVETMRGNMIVCADLPPAA